MEIAIYKPSVTGLKSGFMNATGLAAKKEVVFTKHFRHPSFTISLRPFCVPLDMPAIYSWAWKLSRSANAVAATYLYTGHSDFARSFMALINNRIPVCQIDVCSAEKDELYELYPSAPGDYIIRMLMNTNKKTVRPLHVKALQTCIAYLFQFPEVTQIIADPEADNKLYNEILQKAGFQFEEQLFNQYIVSNLFVCTRQSFIPE
jgi:hypothetical protein